MNAEQMQAEIARLTAENAALAKTPRPAIRLSFKASDKGALSVYGLGRFPVTLYRGQWERLWEVVPQMKKFIADNDDLLVHKDRTAAE